MSGFLETFNEDEEDTKGLLGDGDDRNTHSKRITRSSSKIKGLRSGQIAIFLKTVLICCIFYAMGFTSSIVEKTPAPIDLESSSESSSLPSSTPPTVAHGLGYILGFLLGSFFLSRLNRQFLIFLSLVTMASFLSVIPFADTTWLANSTFGTLGVTKAFLVLGGNVICLDFWGRSSGPYIHAIYFSMSLGLFSGDTIINPLINTLAVPDSNISISNHTRPKRSQVSQLDPVLHTRPKRSQVSQLDPVLHTRPKRSQVSQLDPVLHTRPKRSQVSQLDPVLLQIFDKKEARDKEDLKPIKKVKKPKPKPAFTDGRKLDNSRDWEKVKIAKPDPSLLLPKYSTTTTTTTTTTQSTSTTTKSSADTIEDILADLDPDKMHKRTKRRAGQKFPPSSFYRRRENPDEGFEDNRLYSRKDSSLNDDLSFEANRNGFLYDSVIPMNPSTYYESDYEMPPPKVENAIEVIDQYLLGKANKTNNNNPRLMPTPTYPQTNVKPNLAPNQKDTHPTKNRNLPNLSVFPNANKLDEKPDLASSQKKQLPPNLNVQLTKKNISEPEISSTTKNVETEATTVSTTAAQSTTIIQQEIINSRKPTRTFDQDSEPSRLKTVLNRYGFSGEDVAYMSASLYIFVIAGIMLCCLCYNPREPRSRQDEGLLGEVKHENKIFKCSMLCLMFLFSLLHSGMLTALYQVVPRMLPPSYIPVKRLCLGMVTSTRFLGAAAVLLSSPGFVLFSSLFMSLAGCLLMVIQFGGAWRVWAAFAGQCIGQAALLPASIAWCESYIYISNYAMAAILTGVAIGELITPHMLSLINTESVTATNVDGAGDQDNSLAGDGSAIGDDLLTKDGAEVATWTGWVMVGAAIHLAVVAVAMWLMARKRGNKYSRPEAGGYQRASTQDDALDHLVEEEEDFEMSEPKFGDEEGELVHA